MTALLAPPGLRPLLDLANDGYGTLKPRTKIWPGPQTLVLPSMTCRDSTMHRDPLFFPLELRHTVCRLCLGSSQYRASPRTAAITYGHLMQLSNGVQQLERDVTQLGNVWADTDYAPELGVGVSMSWVICLILEPTENHMNTAVFSPSWVSHPSHGEWESFPLDISSVADG